MLSLVYSIAIQQLLAALRWVDLLVLGGHTLVLLGLHQTCNDLFGIHCSRGSTRPFELACMQAPQEEAFGTAGLPLVSSW